MSGGAISLNAALRRPQMKLSKLGGQASLNERIGLKSSIDTWPDNSVTKGKHLRHGAQSLPTYSSNGYTAEP